MTFNPISVSKPKVYWMMVCYYKGRAIGQGWDVDCNDVPDEYRPDCKDAYDLGASEYADEVDSVPINLNPTKKVEPAEPACPQCGSSEVAPVTLPAYYEDEEGMHEVTEQPHNQWQCLECAAFFRVNRRGEVIDRD